MISRSRPFFKFLKVERNLSKTFVDFGLLAFVSPLFLRWLRIEFSNRRIFTFIGSATLNQTLVNIVLANNFLWSATLQMLHGRLQFNVSTTRTTVNYGIFFAEACISAWQISSWDAQVRISFVPSYSFGKICAHLLKFAYYEVITRKR